MSGHRRASSSDHAFEALYHPIPQAPVAAVPARPSLDLSSDDGAGVAEELDGEALSADADGRIRWIHFILGCAVLLPWNGKVVIWFFGHLSNITVVMITATPFFLSRLDGSPMKSSFSSYLSTTFTAANFGFLAHATATSKQVCLITFHMSKTMNKRIPSLSTVVGYFGHCHAWPS